MPRANGKTSLTLQRDVLRAAYLHALDHGTWATARRVAATLGLTNAAVWFALKELKRRKLVRWDAQRDRGIKVVGVRLQLVYDGEAAERLMAFLHPKANRALVIPNDESDGDG